jgi:hypothetical protein
MIRLGAPNTLIILLKELIANFARVLFTAYRSMNLVNASIITRTCVFPVFVLINGPTWSTCTVWNGCGSFLIGCKKPCGFPPGVLKYKQFRQLLTYLSINCLMRLNQYLLDTNSCILSKAKCPHRRGSAVRFGICLLLVQPI